MACHDLPKQAGKGIRLFFPNLPLNLKLDTL